MEEAIANNKELRVRKGAHHLRPALSFSCYFDGGALHFIISRL